MECSLCILQFSSQKEFQEHSWSLLHHRRIFREKGRAAVHHCSLCDQDIQGFLMYTKHINSDKHRNLLTKYRQLSTKKDAESPTAPDNEISSKTSTTTHSINSNNATHFSMHSPHGNGHKQHWHSTLHQKIPLQQSIQQQFDGLIGVYDPHGRMLNDNMAQQHQNFAQSDPYHYRAEHLNWRNRYPTRRGYDRFDQWNNQDTVNTSWQRHDGYPQRDYASSIATTTGYCKPDVFYKSSTTPKATFTIASRTNDVITSSKSGERQRPQSKKTEKPKKRKLNTPPIRQSSRNKNKTFQSNNSVEELCENLKDLSSRNFSKDNSALSLLNDICSSTDDDCLPPVTFSKNTTKSKAKTSVTRGKLKDKPTVQTVNCERNVDTLNKDTSSSFTNSPTEVDSQIDPVVATSSLQKKSNSVSNLLKSVRPVVVKISKVSDSLTEKEGQSGSTKAKTHKASTEEEESQNPKPSTEQIERLEDVNHQDDDSVNPSEIVNAVDQVVGHHCEFKKAGSESCETVTNDKFCDYHKRVMKAVQLFVSTKVADSKHEVTDAVSLVQSPEPPQEERSCQQDTSEIDSSENRRKGELTETFEHDAEDGQSTIDFSRFKRDRTKAKRKRSHSSCYSSDTSDNNSTNAISTRRRFKYFKHLSTTVTPHELHMNNLPPTVRKLIEKKTKQRRNSLSESENELVSLANSAQMAGTTRHEVGTGVTEKTHENNQNEEGTELRRCNPLDASNKLSGSPESLASLNASENIVTLFNIPAPVFPKLADETQLTDEQQRSGPNLLQSEIQEKLQHLEQAIPVLKEKSSTPTSAPCIQSKPTSLSGLNISEITTHPNQNNTLCKQQSEELTSPNSMISTVSIDPFANPFLSGKTSSSNNTRPLLDNENVELDANNTLVTSDSNQAEHVTATWRNKLDTSQGRELNSTITDPKPKKTRIESHLPHVNSRKPRAVISCTDLNDRGRNSLKEKSRSKRSLKEYQGMSGIQRQLSYLHSEENDLLNELSNTNAAVERLKQKLIILQGNVRDYTERIREISEKKCKLIAKMSTSANESLQLTRNNDINKESNASNVVTPVSSNAGQYITPPRSPVYRNTNTKLPTIRNTTDGNIQRLVNVTNNGRTSSSHTIDSNSGETVVFSKVPKPVTCVKIHEQYVFVALGKPACYVLVKNLQGNNAHRNLNMEVKKNKVTIIEVIEPIQGEKWLCTGSNRSIILLYLFGTFELLRRFDMGCGVLEVVHFNFNRLFVSAQDGTVKCIETIDNIKADIEVTTYPIIGVKHRGVTSMCSAVCRGQPVLYTAARHAAIYAREMNGEVIKSMNFLHGFAHCAPASLAVQVIEDALFAIHMRRRLLKTFSLDGIELRSVRLSKEYQLLDNKCFSFCRQLVILSYDYNRIFARDTLNGTEKEVCRRKHKISHLDADSKKVVFFSNCGNVITIDL